MNQCSLALVALKAANECNPSFLYRSFTSYSQRGSHLKKRNREDVSLIHIFRDYHLILVSGNPIGMRRLINNTTSSIASHLRPINSQSTTLIPLATILDKHFLHKCALGKNTTSKNASVDGSILGI